MDFAEYEGNEYHTEQLRCCNRLGHDVEDEFGHKRFVPGDSSQDPLGAIRDLQRYLRRDSPRLRSFYKQMGKWKVVETKLLPLVLARKNNPELLFQATKLLVMLTMPLTPENATENHELLWIRGKTRKDDRPHAKNGRYWNAEADLLIGYVEAFLKEDVIALFVTMLAGPISRLAQLGVSSETVM